MKALNPVQYETTEVIILTADTVDRYLALPAMPDDPLLRTNCDLCGRCDTPECSAHGCGGCRLETGWINQDSGRVLCEDCFTTVPMEDMPIDTPV